MGFHRSTVPDRGGKALFTWTNAQTTLYSGPLFPEAAGADKLIFILSGGASATSITIYGTIDPAVILSKETSGVMTPNTGLVFDPAYPAPGQANGNWFALNPASVATSPADVVNPITAANGSQYLYHTGGPILAVCGVSGATQTGTSTLIAWAKL